MQADSEFLKLVREFRSHVGKYFAVPVERNREKVCRAAERLDQAIQQITAARQQASLFNESEGEK